MVILSGFSNTALGKKIDNIIRLEIAELSSYKQIIEVSSIGPCYRFTYKNGESKLIVLVFYDS